eukprot:3106507-Amphidinium_carterae.1
MGGGTSPCWAMQLDAWPYLRSSGGSSNCNVLVPMCALENKVRKILHSFTAADTESPSSCSKQQSVTEG